MRQFVIAASFITIASAASAQDASLRVFTGATVYDGTGKPPVTNATIMVEGGRVRAIGPAGSITIAPGSDIVQLNGKFVIPGLINTHGHVNGPDDLETYAAYGVTTVVSLGGEPASVFAARAKQDATLYRSRVYVAGPVLNPRDPAEARSQVADVANQKVDWVKIRVDDNLGTATKMTPEVYRAVIGAAHTRGLRVASHLP